jgi:hypothetical protein
MQAHFAKVLGAIVIPQRNSRYSEASLRLSRGRLSLSGRQKSTVPAKAGSSDLSIFLS